MGRSGSGGKKGKRGQIGADAEPARFFHSTALREHRLDRNPLESCAFYIFTTILSSLDWDLYIHCVQCTVYRDIEDNTTKMPLGTDTLISCVEIYCFRMRMSYVSYF